MITPTAGRVVWFQPNGWVKGGFDYLGEQPCAAHVAYVHGDRNVNLMVIDHAGKQHPMQNVKLLQDEDPKPGPGTGYCQWMPYQQGQVVQWTLVEPRPSVSELETLMTENGSANVKIEPNGDILVRRVPQPA